MGYRKLGRKSDQRKAMLRDLTTDLIINEYIVTTEARAKEVRKTVEKMITLGKRGDLHARRQAAQQGQSVRRLSGGTPFRHRNGDGRLRQGLRVHCAARRRAHRAAVCGSPSPQGGTADARRGGESHLSRRDQGALQSQESGRRRELRTDGRHDGAEGSGGKPIRKEPYVL